MKHEIDLLENEGFIHYDGSLHIKFSIMKNNYMKRVKELEEKKDNYRQIIDKL